MNAATLLSKCLAAQGVDRVFCVPGESYLALLDALVDYAGQIETITCRHEGAAAMMAEADGKMTGRPGLAMVTRGPGASNAAGGVHVAQQDSTPMVLLVGQIGLDMDGRDAFQEVDYKQLFAGMAKWVTEIRNPDRIPEIIAHAWSVAMSGRPGPVVIALPEDMLSMQTDAAPCAHTVVSRPAPSQESLEILRDLLEKAENPIAILGGSRWDEQSARHFVDFATSWDLPVACSFRRQMLVDHHHPNYAGEVGMGLNPALRRRVKTSDLLLLVGGRLSELPSQKYDLLEIPGPNPNLVHVHPGAEELERVYQAKLVINATPDTFLVSAPRGSLDSTRRAKSAHDEYLNWSTPVGRVPGSVQMHDVVAHLENVLDSDAIMTNGAGNYTVWMQRFHRFRQYGTQISPVSGSMGYGLPAAIAAGLRHPGRQILCLAGDGCFQMTGQEFATAVQYGVKLVVIVIDNGMFGTIRMHQERSFPGRVSATRLQNPDFAMIARAAGGFGETVESTVDFEPVFARACASPMPALIHLRVDARAMTPDLSLDDIRSDG